MTNLKVVLTISAILFCSISFSQKDIKYQNRALARSLQKQGISSYSEIREIGIPDSVADSHNIQGKFFKNQSNRETNSVTYIYIGRVNSCRAGGCSISNNQATDLKSEYFDYFILFDNNKTVTMVKVFNYQATHGQEVTAKGWLKQFAGYDGSEKLEVDKNIDSISGATISVYAIVLDIELKTEILKNLK